MNDRLRSCRSVENERALCVVMVIGFFFFKQVKMTGAKSVLSSTTKAMGHQYAKKDEEFVYWNAHQAESQF